MFLAAAEVDRKAPLSLSYPYLRMYHDECTLLLVLQKKIPEQELRSPQFVRTLAEAIIRASTSEAYSKN